jgi:hypothetical protein
MNSLQPSIDGILDSFFSRKIAAAKGIAQRRKQQVHLALRDYLESEGQRALTSSEATILAAEREIDPVQAFARTQNAEVLVFTLSEFVVPPWLFPDRLLRREQLTLVDALVGQILRDRLVSRDDLACPLIELRVRLDLATGELNRERREKERARKRGVGA